MVSKTVRFNKAKLFLAVVIIIAVVAGIVLAFRSCGGVKNPTPPNTSGFTCDIALKVGDLDVAGSLDRPSVGQCNFTVKSPEALTGMVFSVDGDGVKVTYLGMSMDLKDVKLPAANFLLPLAKALDSSQLIEDLKVETHSGGNTFKGTSALGDFELVCDRNGRINSIILPSHALEINLNNYVE